MSYLKNHIDLKNYIKNLSTKFCKASILFSPILSMLNANIAHAGSFSLYTESSAAAIGNYAAGIAAQGEDASIGWYNPAGLALIHQQQIILGGVGVFPKTRLTGTSTYLTPFFPEYIQTFDGINGAKNALVPSLHYALPLGKDVTFGLSLVSPFGLSTDWTQTGPLRYSATNSKLLTSNFSPEIGGNLTENFSFGLGLDLQYARVTFNRMLGSPAILDAIGMGATYWDSSSTNKGDSFGVGFHAGIMVILNDNHSRIGLNYQSEMSHTFYGNSRLQGRLADAPFLFEPNSEYVTNSLKSNTVKLPAIITLSAYHDISSAISLLGSIVYTGWHSFKTIELYNVAAFNPLTLSNVPANSISTQYYRNTWRAALGANYQINPNWLVRLGGGYDQTPTNDVNRDVRIPDGNRWALSIGTRYLARDNLSIDLGYTHLFSIGNPQINKADAIGANTYTINATANNRADLVGLQLNWFI